MVQLVTVRTLTEATQHRRLVTAPGVVQGCTHHQQGRGQLLQPSGASTGEYLPPHHITLTTHHRTDAQSPVTGDTEIFINGVRMAL